MTPKAFKKVFINTWLSEMEYRSNYLVLIFSSVVFLIMDWSIYDHLYENQTVIGGLTHEQAIFFVLLGILLRVSQIIWSTITECIDEIRNGSFRRYILQPIWHPLYYLAHVLGDRFTSMIMAAITIAIFCALRNYTPPFMADVQSFAHFMIAFGMSALMLWLIYLLIVYSSFFLEESHFLMLGVNIGLGVVSGSVVPLGWLAPWMQKMVRATPLPLMGDWPVRSGLGLISTAEWNHNFLMAALWMALLMIALRVMWIRGLRNYEAFGG